VSELTLTARQIRYTNKAFWRNPAAAFFTFIFPLMFLVIFATLLGSGTVTLESGREFNQSTYYVASMAVFSVITACYTNKAFWRNPAAAFFTFVFPLMFLVIFATLLGSGTVTLESGREFNQSTYYVASMAVFSVITACYTNLAIGVTFQRDAGILKRTRGTPLPGSAYLGARVIHVMILSILLVVICAAFGWLFYDADLPTGMSLIRSIIVVLVGSASFAALGLALTPTIPNADAAPPIVTRRSCPCCSSRASSSPSAPMPRSGSRPSAISSRFVISSTPSWGRSTGRRSLPSHG
jgi:hypothetical protein